MREWDAQRLAEAAGARLMSPPDERPGPSGASVDTRELAPGQLFVGLAGARDDGGRFAAQALAAGAWGVLVAPEHAPAAIAQGGGAVLTHEQPLLALQALGRAWRRELGARGARVVAITGSTGKTSTKDILAALLAGAGLRVAASPANHNTEIGLPLALLAAGADTQALVLEMAMRGPGQIAQLTAIAEPQVGVIVNVGPAHLELLGSLEAIAAAKAELIAGLQAGASVVVPAGEPLLAAHLRGDLRTITFGEGGDVRLREPHGAPRRQGGVGRVAIDHAGESIELRPSFAQAHNLRNLLAAVAAARALGVTPRGRLYVRFSAMRGQRERLASGVEVIDDCYNANPMSMRAALDELAASAPGRRVAVLGDMLELGERGPGLHREIGEHARDAGVEVLVTVGPLAASIGEGFGGETLAAADAQAAGELLEGLLREGDKVLVKGSRGVGLERVVEHLRSAATAPLAAAAGAATPESSDAGTKARASLPDAPRAGAPAGGRGRR